MTKSEKTMVCSLKVTFGSVALCLALFLVILSFYIRCLVF